MTGKLDGFRAISTNTVTNAFCQKMNTSGDTICRPVLLSRNAKIIPEEHAAKSATQFGSAIRPRAGSIGIADNLWMLSFVSMLTVN
jgi:hypothetical protein